MTDDETKATGQFTPYPTHTVALYASDPKKYGAPNMYWYQGPAVDQAFDAMKKERDRILEMTDILMHQIYDKFTYVYPRAAQPYLDGWNDIKSGIEFKRELEDLDKYHEEETKKLQQRLDRAVAALRDILNEGNMATQGKWDATDDMKKLAFAALRELGEDK